MIFSGTRGFLGAVLNGARGVTHLGGVHWVQRAHLVHPLVCYQGHLPAHKATPFTTSCWPNSCRRIASDSLERCRDYARTCVLIITNMLNRNLPMGRKNAH
eukprot:1180551-Prorocentrum_minimum.AAC.1